MQDLEQKIPKTKSLQGHSTLHTFQPWQFTPGWHCFAHTSKPSHTHPLAGIHTCTHNTSVNTHTHIHARTHSNRQTCTPLFTQDRTLISFTCYTWSYIYICIFINIYNQCWICVPYPNKLRLGRVRKTLGDRCSTLHRISSKAPTSFHSPIRLGNTSSWLIDKHYQVYSDTPLRAGGAGVGELMWRPCSLTMG